MRIYIVRHGETNANREGYLQGWTNEPLNENGREIAKITGLGMNGIKFDYCISSPLSRARETAEIILRASRNYVSMELENRIKEINFGDFERISIKDERVIQFLQQPDIDYKYPNGESISDVMCRAQAFLRELINRNDGKTYLVSTHGCTLRAMLNYLYSNPIEFWHGHVPYNCCVNIIETEGEKCRLIADDLIYYNKDLVIDRYKL